MTVSRPAPARRRLALATVLAASALTPAACGSDDDPTSTTDAAAGAPTESSVPAPADELSPEWRASVEEYRAFASVNAREHLRLFDDFAAALEAGDIERAKDIYPEARMPWERIEPVAALFGDLDPALDAREGDVPGETWGGWHYFENALWTDGSVEGLAKYVTETRADAEKLVEVTKTIEMTPNDVASGAVDLLGEVSASKITGEEERYSHTDLWDFAANVEGSAAAFEAVAPLVSDAALVREVRGRFDDLQAALAGYERGDGYVLYTEVTEAERRELSRLLDATAEPLSLIGSNLEG